MVEDQQEFQSKADFSKIYDQPDPRDYFAALGPLDYQIPQQALPVVTSVWDAAEAGGARRTGLDICCSYGINGALLRFEVDLGDLERHYAGNSADGLDVRDTLAVDRAFFAEHARPDARTVLGLDAADNAIAYARGTGLIDDGWAANLEQGAVPADLAAGVADVGVLVCTGGVGYIGPATFRAVLESVQRPDDLWLAVFVLRVYDYGPIIEVLGDYGLVTERLPGTFLQRRFADLGEQEAAIADVQAHDLDPTGKEAAGWFHAEAFVSRPRSTAGQHLSSILPERFS